jgi:DNA-binding IclR family transcriptional regulator
MEKLKKGTTIQSLEIGMGILDFVAHQAKPCKFTEIQEYTQITKSNLYKYLNTFTHLGILYRDMESGAYVLGSKLIEYGMAAVDQENVLDRITPYLELLNIKTLNTVLFSIWTQNGPMVIKMLNITQGLNIGAQIGTLLPPISAAGKIFIAFMDKHIVQEWKEAGTNKFTIDQLQQLDTELERIKEEEISFAREPLVPSVSSVAIPVLNYKKNLLGAVTVVGFSEKIPKNETEEPSKIIMEISKEISRSFGYNSSK